jgi:hypothetical protein
VLGRDTDAARYETLAAAIRAAFRRTYFDPVRRQFDQGTQFANALPLVLGLADEAEREGVIANILASLDRRGGHFDVGVLGAKYLIEALTDHGRPDVAFGLVTKTGYPSWAHMLEGGRTTLSEFWDLHGSHNHAMMGSVDAWFYRTLAGIRVDETRPGFEHFVVQPYVPDELGRVTARVETLRGEVAVAWRRHRGELRLRVAIPVDSEATVHVPASAGARVRCHPARSAVRREDRPRCIDSVPGLTSSGCPGREGSFLAQRVANGAVQGCFASRAEAHEGRSEDSLAIDDDGRGDSLDAELAADRTVGVEGHGEGVAVVVEELLRHQAILAEVDGEDAQAAFLQAGVLGDLLEVGQGLAAGRAPGGPEIEHHGAAFQVGQPDFVARDRVQFEPGAG